MIFSLKRIAPTAFSFITAVGGLLLLACVSTTQTPTAATSFSPIKMTDEDNLHPGNRGVASDLTGATAKSFKFELGSAAALNSYLGLLGYNMEKNSKLLVVAKWSMMAPDDVHREFVTKTDGFDIGYHRSRVSGHSSQIRVITQAENASEITQNTILFTPDVPTLEGADTDRDQKLIDQQLPVIERDLQSIVTQLIQDNHYEGRHLNGHAFARLDLVSQLGLTLSEAVNAKYFGLAALNPLKSRQWSHAWRDQLDANLANDPRVTQAAQETLKEVTAARAGLRTPLSAREILRLVSREYETETGVTQAIDILLKNPTALDHARLASQQARMAELDALITEALRLKPTAPYQLFYVKDDFTLHSGLVLKKGQSLLVLNSVANRDEIADKPTGLTHFAETEPEARLVQAEVRAVIGALVVLPGMHRVSGDAGQIERRFVIAGATSPLAHDELRYTFPESMAVEWTIAQPTAALQIVSLAYAYDDYLNDYDRDEFRLCASSQLPDGYSETDIIPAIARGLQNKNVVKRDNKDLFFCRLEKNFRTCLLKEAKAQNFFYLDAGDKARAAYGKCESLNHLTPTENAFYSAVMFGDPLNEKKLTTSQAQRTSGPAYRFEDYLKFYNHYTASQSLMNPVGMAMFNGKNRDLLFYVRLNLDFRTCIGAPVVAHNVLAKVGIKAFRDLEHQYDFCKNGVWNQASLRREGALSDEERHFYETIMLGRQINQ